MEGRHPLLEDGAGGGDLGDEINIFIHAKIELSSFIHYRFQ